MHLCAFILILYYLYLFIDTFYSHHSSSVKSVWVWTYISPNLRAHDVSAWCSMHLPKFYRNPIELCEIIVKPMGEYAKPMVSMVWFECKTHGLRFFLTKSSSNSLILASAQVGPGMSRASRGESFHATPSTDEIGRWKMRDAAGTEGPGRGLQLMHLNRLGHDMGYTQLWPFFYLGNIISENMIIYHFVVWNALMFRQTQMLLLLL